MRLTRRTLPKCRAHIFWQPRQRGSAKVNTCTDSSPYLDTERFPIKLKGFARMLSCWVQNWGIIWFFLPYLWANWESKCRLWLRCSSWFLGGRFLRICWRSKGRRYPQAGTILWIFLFGMHSHWDSSKQGEEFVLSVQKSHERLPTSRSKWAAFSRKYSSECLSALISGFWP